MLKKELFSLLLEVAKEELQKQAYDMDVGVVPTKMSSDEGSDIGSAHSSPRLVPAQESDEIIDVVGFNDLPPPVLLSQIPGSPHAKTALPPSAMSGVALPKIAKRAGFVWDDLSVSEQRYLRSCYIAITHGRSCPHVDVNLSLERQDSIWHAIERSEYQGEETIKRYVRNRLAQAGSYPPPFEGEVACGKAIAYLKERVEHPKKKAASPRLLTWYHHLERNRNGSASQRWENLRQTMDVPSLKKK